MSRRRQLRLLLAVVTAAGCSGGQPRASTSDSAATPIPPAIRTGQQIAVEGRAPSGAEPVNPFAGDKRSEADGEKLFASMNCDGCHGGGATGAIGPSLSDARWRYGGSDGAVYQSIFYGRPQGMPAFGGLLQEPLIWKLVTYLRSLPVPKAVPTQVW
jgi:cytochrome c oxidase cbb3-type subunit III